MIGNLLLPILLLTQSIAAAPGLDIRQAKNSCPAATTVTVTVTAPTSKAMSSTTFSSSSRVTPTTSKSLATPTVVSPPQGKLGKRNVLYFTNWGVYGANYQPQDLPADQVTHLLYAFADIGQDGTVKSSDSWSDVELHYKTDSWQDTGNNAYGCIKQLYILKQKNRRFKTLLSIGGWTYSPKFAPVAATSAGRQQFVSSAIKLMGDWGFDGLDIDWEYPNNPTEAADYVKLLKELRAGLDKYSTDNKLNYHFLLTVASPAGPTNIKAMDMKGMDQYLDAWHLMGYDYAGSWDPTTGHGSNLFKNKNNMASTPFSTNEAVSAYFKAGIPSDKIILGMPLYGHSFAGTEGMGKPSTGRGGGSIEQGFWLYKDLPRPGAKVTASKGLGAIYSYDSSSKELVTYDDITSSKYKLDYMTKNRLGGAMFWEASGDKKGDQSLVGFMAKNMGDLDTTLNNLKYPLSKYDNIRNGMA